VRAEIATRTAKNFDVATMKPHVPITDFLSNVARFKIIDSTLREGEQYVSLFLIPPSTRN
jgi:homocitrate synthase